MYPAAPEPELHPPLPEFIEGSSSDTKCVPQPDVDSLARRLYATASFNDDDDSLWKQDGEEKWLF